MFSVDLRAKKCIPLCSFTLFMCIYTLPITYSWANSPTDDYFDEPTINCPSSSEIEYYQCMQETYESADQALNTLYKELIKTADPTQKNALRNMQRVWVDLKESQCEFVGNYYSVRPDKRILACQTVMTIRRVEALKKLDTGIMWD